MQFAPGYTSIKCVYALLKTQDLLTVGQHNLGYCASFCHLQKRRGQIDVPFRGQQLLFMG